MASRLQIPLLFHFLCFTSPHWEETVMSSVTPHKPIARCSTRQTVMILVIIHGNSHHLGYDAVLNGRQTSPTDLNINQHRHEKNKYSNIFILFHTFPLYLCLWKNRSLTKQQCAIRREHTNLQETEKNLTYPWQTNTQACHVFMQM
jgi:hypothetical protein